MTVEYHGAECTHPEFELLRLPLELSLELDVLECLSEVSCPNGRLQAGALPGPSRKAMAIR